MSQRSRIGKRELPRAPAAVACRGKELLAYAYGFSFLKRTRLCLRAWLLGTSRVAAGGVRQSLPGDRFLTRPCAHAASALILFQKNRRSTPDQDRSVPGSRDRNRHRQICRWPPDGVLPRARMLFSPRSPARECSGLRRQMPLDREVLPAPASLLRPSNVAMRRVARLVLTPCAAHGHLGIARSRAASVTKGLDGVALRLPSMHRPFRRRSVPPLDRSPQSRSAV